MRPSPTIRVLALLAATVARPAPAGTSANYSLAPETIDTGGGRGTSASYTVNAASTHGAAGASTTYGARGGFAGQLTDAPSLVLVATPSAVNEGASRQIDAFLVQDESILVPQNASTLTWSIVSGPLTNVSPSGLATAGPVYQTTPATVRGTLGTLGATLDLQVMNSLPDNFGSYAGDRLDDSWQVQYFGLDNPEAAPSLDPDGDTQDNRFEFDAGVVPTDASSKFSIDFAPVPGHPLLVGVRFSPRWPDRTYTLFGSTGTDRTAAVPVTGGPVINTGTERVVADPDAGAQRKFYHVRITRP